MPVIGRRLAVGGRQVSVTNLGIPAAVLSPAIQALGNQYNRGIPGNFLEQELPFVPRTATVVTIFAGGNDANAIGTALAGGEGGFDPLGWIEQQVRGFATDYQTLVRGVKERAPSATIVVANLPNFAGMPFTRDWTPEKRLILQRITVGMTVQGINGFAFHPKYKENGHFYVSYTQQKPKRRVIAEMSASTVSSKHLVNFI